MKLLIQEYNIIPELLSEELKNNKIFILKTMMDLQYIKINNLSIELKNNKSFLIQLLKQNNGK